MSLAPELGSWTNVYGLGVTIISLINLDVYPKQVVFSQPKSPPVQIKDERRFYSHALKDLVMQCVAVETIDRIPLDQLMIQLSRHTNVTRRSALSEAKRARQLSGQRLLYPGRLSNAPILHSEPPS